MLLPSLLRTSEPFTPTEQSWCDNVTEGGVAHTKGRLLAVSASKLLSQAALVSLSPVATPDELVSCRADAQHILFICPKAFT